MNSKKKMRVELKTSYKNSVVRLVTVTLLGAIQIWWIVYMIIDLEKRHSWMSTVISLTTILVAFSVYCRNMNAEMKMPWMILIAGFPILGVCLYLLMGRPDLTKRTRRNFREQNRRMSSFLRQDPETAERLRETDLGAYRSSWYLQNEAYMPVWQGTETAFYSDGADGLKAQNEALRSAKSFIFMEYHAIEDAEWFEEMHEILREKAREGVEVRLLYDEVGSIGFLNRDFIRRMEEDGIECRVFNPISAVLRVFMNNRDHRKITVIDGQIGFTGGYNLANEYFHITKPLGFWKDTGLRLEGLAVQSLTAQFLEMWNFVKLTDEDPSKYFCASAVEGREKGFVQPYGSGPMTELRIAEDVYMNIIRNARHYVYFVTPYLILTDEMMRELTSAAQRGIDVRIIIPGIPDKKMVYRETRSFCTPLIRGGVRIYTYTPGFSHAKMCISDDRTVVIGTINLDYRSLYHHFENAVLFFDSSITENVKEDFREMFGASEEVTEDMPARRTFLLGETFLRLVAPLL